MDVLTLLRSKNRCLGRFLEISVDFLNTVDQEKLDGLTEFQNQREATLKAIGLYDRKISEVVTLLSPDQKSPELVESVKQELNKKERIIHEILDTDLKIISIIEDTKNKILQEISSTRKHKDMIGKFKSTWVSEAGDELDSKL